MSLRKLSILQRNFVIKRANSFDGYKSSKHDQMNQITHLILERAQACTVPIPVVVDNCLKIDDSADIVRQPSFSKPTSPSKAINPLPSLIKHHLSGHEDDWLFHGNLDALPDEPFDDDNSDIE